MRERKERGRQYSTGKRQEVSEGWVDTVIQTANKPHQMPQVQLSVLLPSLAERKKD
jgi:hypothetical protein